MKTTVNAVPARVLAAVALSLAAHAARAEDADKLEEVSITGSRIAHAAGMATPTPVAALSATDLADMAPSGIAEAMTQVPQFYGSATPATFNAGANVNGGSGGFFTSSGGGSLNLRGVGTKRTLTLLDGRRVTPSTIYGGPDINLFPSALLKTVETVTGGASAAYGTDAVSGVANFILNTKFNGIQGEVQRGQTSRGDAQNSQYSLAMGHGFSNGLHVLFSAEHAEQDSVETWKGRNWYQDWGLVQNSAAGAGNSQSNPKYIAAPHITSTLASYDGIITGWTSTTGAAVPGLGRLAFNSDGSVQPFQLGSTVGLNGAQTGGSGTDNNSDRPNVMPAQKRTSVFTYIDDDVTDHLNLYVQGMYGQEMLRAVNNGGLFQVASGNQPITIFADNAYLPASLRAAMTANNLASFTMGRIGYSSDLAGNAYVQQDTKTVSGTLGFKSTLATNNLFNGWHVDGYWQYGKTDVDAAQQGGIRVDRISLALDAVVNPATGAIQCHVTVVSGKYPDCVPLNLFGRGNASQAAVNWVTGFDPGVAVTTTPYLPGQSSFTYSYVGDEYKHRLIALQQHVAEVVANGDLWQGFGAGPVSAAVGAHYRKETVAQDVEASQGNPAADPFVLPVPRNDPTLGIRGTPGGALNNSVEFQFSKVPFIRGGYDVKETFAETLVPLLADKPFLKQLNFNGAVRWADYGGSGSIWSYKGGLDASLTDELRLRGTYSRDVRAANLGERFDRTGGAATITDRAPGASAVPYSITIVQGGNPDVNPEKADTVTAGFVYRPHWLDGFDMSVDWLDVRLKDAIESFTAQQIIDACYLQGNADQCKYIDRSGPNNTIYIVNQTVQNVSKATIRSIDVEMGYSRPVDLFGGGERVGVRLFSTWLGENSTTSSTGVKTDRAGEVGNYALPKWKLTGNLTYTRGPFRAFLQARYIGSGLLSATYNNTVDASGNKVWDVANNSVGSVMYYDTRVSYDFDLAGGTLQLYANVNNLLDKDPPVTPSYSAFSAAASQVNPALYDVLGRRFVVGVKLTF